MAKVPTLTSMGWAGDPATMAARLIDYALTSEHSQTKFYTREVFSIPYLIQQHGDEPRRLATTMEDKLFSYFSRYFDTANVSVTADALDSNDGRYNLKIDVNLTLNGQRHSLGRLLQVGESKIFNVTDTRK